MHAINRNLRREMKNLDLKLIIDLVEQGTLGKLVEMESADGDIVEVVVD